MKKALKICSVLLIVTAVAGMGYGALGTVSILRAGPATSFPWWTAWVFAAVYFVPLLAVETVICTVLHRYIKRKEE